MPRPELSLVIPIYNEEAVLPRLDVRLKELLDKLGIDTEVVFVNDGSRDASIDILRRLASREPRYRVLGFSRNFGHQRAITAGMDKSRGQAVVVMDADLQDPPEVILEMVEKWKAGYDVVYGRRRSREGESWFKLATAKIFYRVFAALIPIEVPLDTGDFRLMSRRVVMTMRGLRETHRFVRGLVAWVGFKQTAVEYDRAARAAGETKYPLRKMLAFAFDGIASFSIQPLRFATYVGALVGAASVLYAIAAAITYYAGMNVPGWTTLVILVAFLFSVQFFMIGVLGEYVGRIYEQVKGRPLYIVSERINFRRRKVEKLVTQDIEELQAKPPPPVLPAAAGASAGSAVSVTPPPAPVATGATAAGSNTRPPPAVKPARQPSAPAISAKPPPQLNLSPSASDVPVTPPPRPVAPPPRVAPSAAPPRVSASTPSKVSASTPSKVSASTPPPPRVAPSVPPPRVSASTPPPPKVSPSVPPPRVSPSTHPKAASGASPAKMPSVPPKSETAPRSAKELFGVKRTTEPTPAMSPSRPPPANRPSTHPRDPAKDTKSGTSEAASTSAAKEAEGASAKDATDGTPPKTNGVRD